MKLNIKIVLAILNIFLLLFIFLGRDEEKFALSSANKIVIALFSRPKQLDIYKVGNINAYKILSSVHLGLVLRDYNGKTFSGAAKTWQIKNEGKTYIFELRKDLFFHNGFKMTCEDVHSSFDRFLHSYASNPVVELIESYSCIEPYYFQVQLSRKSSAFLSSLADLEASIVPKKSLSKEQEFIGVGPYKIININDDEIELLQHPGSPFLKKWSAKRIKFRFFDEEDSAVEEFNKGNVDIVYLRDMTLNQSEKQIVKSYFYNALRFMLASPSIKKKYPKLVSYINATLDRQKLANILNQDGEIYTPAFGVISPYRKGHYDGRTDQKKMRVLKPDIKEPIEVLYVKSTNKKMLNLLKNYFDEVGIEVQMKKVSISELIQRKFSNDYDLAYYGFGTSAFSERMLWYFYGEKPILPVLLQADQVLHRLEQIDRVGYDKNENLIRNFEKDMFLHGHFVPVLFQRSQYLVNKCINIENISSVSPIELFHEIGKINGCKDQKNLN